MYKVFVGLLLSLNLYAAFAPADIQSSFVAGRRSFYVIAGTFAHKNNALQYKLQLSAQFKHPFIIDYLSSADLYLVKTPPLYELSAARQLKQAINQSHFVADTTTTEDKPAPAKTAQVLPKTQKIWNLRNADIRAVIAEISRITHKNFIIDPKVKGKISIVSTHPMSDKELYQVFLSMLQVSGFAAIPTGSVIKIVPNMEAKTATADRLSTLQTPPQGDAMLVEVIPVRYVPADQFIPVLRPLMPQWSSISAYMPSNMLILSGRANNIRRLADIIKQVDTPNANGIDVIPLKHALAMDMASMLKELMKSQTNANSVRLAPMLAADDRNNAILLSGSRTERLRLRLLIEKLDKDRTHGLNGTTQVVYLNYLRAEDLVPILAGIAQANFSGNVGTTIGTITRPPLDSTNPASNLANNNTTTPNAPSSNTNAAASIAPNTSMVNTQNEGTSKPTVQIIAEPNTNSIVLNAPASLIHILRRVISQLDIRPAQLLIEALVVEVDESDVKQLGIEWGSNQQTGNPGDFRPGFAIINSQTAINDFQAQLYALTQKRKANILSTPSVVVLDNRQAKILVGKQVSVATTTYPNNAGGTTVGSPYVTFDRVNVALHLYVRPQITRGKGIQLQIDQGNDTLDPSTTINANPTFKISSIVTSVHVDSGDIVVLGGLSQDSLGNDNNGLPILENIPGVGRLFQRKLRNREKKVLMVFIKPVILRSERDGIQISGGKYNDLREYQLEWLRNQPYNRNNDDMLLPALETTALPRPFTKPLVSKALPAFK